VISTGKPVDWTRRSSGSKDDGDFTGVNSDGDGDGDGVEGDVGVGVGVDVIPWTFPILIN